MRELNSQFLFFLEQKPIELVELYINLRSYLLSFNPNCFEILYKSQALTSVYSFSDKLEDAYCHIPVYKKHINLGFNFGSKLNDPANLLKGAGKYIRHIRIENEASFNNSHVEALIKEALGFSRIENGKPGITISKIKGDL